MTKTRRIFHHACWFALLGPHLGVPVTFAGELLPTTARRKTSCCKSS
ncbi:hypothetical protein [Lelliottia amnigena]